MEGVPFTIPATTKLTVCKVHISNSDTFEDRKTKNNSNLIIKTNNKGT